MQKLIMNRDELRDKIYGCWMGKNIGGTLGMPYEGNPDMHDVQGYTNVSDGEPVPNDDLDLQIVWLHALREYGPRGVNAAILGEHWLTYIIPHWAEYGNSKANQRTGLVPPISGMFDNAWLDSNGAWIRSEIWACIAPGCPDIAIKYAYEDASVDHGSGEGMYAELFTAAIESAAFVLGDRDELIQIGLSKIPADCRVARSVNLAIDAYKSGRTWQEARKILWDDSADLCWFPAPANIGFIIIGWLYGEGDFGASIRIAVNCGDDTDCTAATLGSILGIIGGKSSIPAEWIDPIGDKIVTLCIDKTVWPPINPATVSELTDQVMSMVPEVLAAFNAPMEISDAPTDLSGLADSKLNDSEVANKICSRPPYSVDYDFFHTKVNLDYGKAPVIKSGEPFRIKLTFATSFALPRHLEMTWLLPDGWKALPSNKSFISLNIPDSRYPSHFEVVADVLPDEVRDQVNRGVLQIVAQGRPTVGLIPLVFMNGDTECKLVREDKV